MPYPHRGSHDLRLNITLAPGEGTVGTAGTNLKEKDLLKEDESKLKDDDHIYEEPSKYLDANFTNSPAEYSEPVPHPHSQVPASKRTNKPNVPPPRQPKDKPLNCPHYQSVGSPARYAVSWVSGEATMTRNDVPQPTTGGSRDVRGEPPNLDCNETLQENEEQDDYVEMKTSASY